MSANERDGTEAKNNPDRCPDPRGSPRQGKQDGNEDQGYCGNSAERVFAERCAGGQVITKEVSMIKVVDAMVSAVEWAIAAMVFFMMFWSFFGGVL